VTVHHSIPVQRNQCDALFIKFINSFSLGGFQTLKSTMPGHFTTLWKSRSTSTLSGRLVREAAMYIHSAGTESVNTLRTGIFFLYINHKSLIQSKVTFFLVNHALLPFFLLLYLLCN
jgi:hypothetical protein